MSRNLMVRVLLGILVIAAGLLGLLWTMRIVLLGSNVLGALFIIGFGVWIVLCATECHGSPTA